MKAINGLVSIIIPTFNRRQFLCECIDSVLKQQYNSLEIIVVDDCSQDDTVEYLAHNYKGVSVIKLSFHCGPAHSRNKGLAASKGEYVLFLDSDVVLPNDQIISTMVEQLKKSPFLGQIGGEIPIYLGTENYARGVNLSFWGDSQFIICKKSDPVFSCDYLATCNCMSRKKAIQLVGGFDPYFNFGSEDLDFGYRLMEKGFLNYVNFQTSIHHRHVPTGRYDDESFRYKYSRIRFFFKHFSTKKIITIFLKDFIFVILFYVHLIPKIIIKKIRKEKLLLSNLLGGYFILKAYLLNIFNYRAIKAARDVNFLKKEEIEKYEMKILQAGPERY